MRTDALLRTVPGDQLTPCGIAAKFGAKVLLESSSLAGGRARFSLLLLDEAFSIIQQGATAEMIIDGVHTNVGDDVLKVLQQKADENPRLPGDIPTPTGGYGFLSYEYASRCDPAITFTEKEDPSGMYDAQFLFGHIHVIFDHAVDRIHVYGVNYDCHQIDLERAVEDVIERMHDLDFNYLTRREQLLDARIISDEAEDRMFLEGVKTLREEIIKGNLLQCVLSRRLKVESSMDAFEAYKRLRAINPSPYMFYLDLSGQQLFGSSPEVMIKVRDGEAVLRPIAGTRRRGANSLEDAELERELLADEKELAEHTMLIDLARNDLGRVCRTGSVRLTEKMGIERYSHVMHIVSEVTGTLKEGCSAADAVHAVFPAGTVSGAPKIQAIRTLDRIERQKRSWYAGLVGYMEPGGDLDTCITIRTALKSGKEMYLHAGAGIVFDSEPERELEETNEKLRAMAKSLGLEV